jgi:hypothetical protein
LVRAGGDGQFAEKSPGKDVTAALRRHNSFLLNRQMAAQSRLDEFLRKIEWRRNES